MAEFKLPTETVELPSKGLLYPESSPLAKGEIEMKYMTAKEEDILTNSNYIRQGVVIDKLLRSLIITEGVNYNEILTGDKNAIMLAARILSYGKDYSFRLGEQKIDVDLSEINNKPLHESIDGTRKNEFTFSLPSSGNVVTFKLLSHGDELSIEKEIAGNKKLNKEATTDITSRLKHIITSVNGQREQKDIREFVDNYLLAKDARALRDQYSKVQPDIDLTISYTGLNGGEEEIDLPIGLDFFWPDLKL
jgi:hypothetical protein